MIMLQETLGTIRDVLREHTHNGFPVVQASHVGDVFIGVILRSHLKVRYYYMS